MDQTISQYIIQFETHLLVEKKVRPNTFCAYKNDLRQWQTFLQSHNIYTLNNIKQSHLESFANKLKEKHQAITTVQRKLSVFKLFWKYCSLVMPNQLPNVTIPQVESTLPFCCSQEQIQTIINQAQGHLAKKHLQAIIFTLLLHEIGLTCTEIARLRIHDLDKKKRALRIGNATISLNPILWNIIDEYCQRLASTLRKQNTHVFLVAGKRISEQTIINSVKKLIKKNQRIAIDPQSFFVRSETKNSSNELHKAYTKHPRT